MTGDSPGRRLIMQRYRDGWKQTHIVPRVLKTCIDCHEVEGENRDLCRAEMRVIPALAPRISPRLPLKPPYGQ